MCVFLVYNFLKGMSSSVLNSIEYFDWKCNSHKIMSHSNHSIIPQHYIAFQFSVMSLFFPSTIHTQTSSRRCSVNNAHTHTHKHTDQNTIYRRQVYLEERTLLCTFNGFVRCVRSVEMYIVNNQNGFVVPWMTCWSVQ